MSLETPGYVISADSHSAALFRQTHQSLFGASGVVGAADLAVSQNASPNMSVEVAPGIVQMAGTQGSATGMLPNLGSQHSSYSTIPAKFTSQGLYVAYNDGETNEVIATADATNPRIDLICSSVQDAQYSGSENRAILQVLTGTPAAIPSPPTPPENTVVLAEVEVKAKVTKIETANITDKRTIGGVLPRFSGLGYTGTAEEIPSESETLLKPSTLLFDTLGGYAAGVFTAPIAGYYQFIAAVKIESGGPFQLFLKANSALVTETHGESSGILTGTVYLTAEEKAEVQATATETTKVMSRLTVALLGR